MTGLFVPKVEENFCAALELFGLASQAITYKDEEVSWYFTGGDSPLLNGVTRSHFLGDHVDEKITAVCRTLAAYQKSFSWWVSPSSQPTDLGQQLQRRGLQWVRQNPGMAVELTAVPAAPTVKLADTFTIHPVTDFYHLEPWLKSWAINFAVLPEIVDFSRQLYQITSFTPPFYWRNFVGCYQNRPVATASLFITGDTAGLYNLSVVPEMRRLGIGSAMTCYILQRGKELGCQLGGLQATHLSHEMYQKLGFEEVCSFQQYIFNLPSNKTT